MLFVFHGVDKEDGARLRASKLSAHLEYLRASPSVRLAGPLLDEKGGMNGTLLVLEAESKASAEAWLTDEPFCRAGLFAAYTLIPWLNMHCTLGRR